MVVAQKDRPQQSLGRSGHTSVPICHGHVQHCDRDSGRKLEQHAFLVRSMAYGLLSTRYRTECGGCGTAEYLHMSHSNGSITSMIGLQTSEEDSLWLVGLNFFPVVGYPPRDNTNVGCIYPPLETRSITLFFLQVCLSGLQFFHGSITFEPWRRVWRSWAPAKCKIFL